MLALQIFTKTTGSHRQIAGENWNSVVENVDVGYFMADVDEANGAAHRGGIVHFKGVVERKSVDVHLHWRDASLCKDAQLGFDQIALGCDKEHAHLVTTVAVLVQNLEIQLHRVDVGHMLLCFPAH